MPGWSDMACKYYQTSAQYSPYLGAQRMVPLFCAPQGLPASAQSWGRGCPRRKNVPLTPVRRFCLIRHGWTDANRDGWFSAFTETQLTDVGRNSARRSAHLPWPTSLRLFVIP
ncbi:histidine phosphatase family protein [Paracoccus sp. PAR01]|uniref:histidine phosphatase family protein n=1 Tax=Paracoccus sp. PAR01 TaxID=2769282 RepID=UPI00351C4D15